MNAKQTILAEMKNEIDTDDVHVAVNYLIQLVEAGMDFADAEAKVLECFDEIGQDELQEAYDQN